MTESRGNAMTYEVATAQLRKLLDAGFTVRDVSIRPRTWDTEGRYAAVEVATGVGANRVTTPLYNPTRVDEFIAASRPVDTVPAQESTRYGVPVFQFRTGTGYGSLIITAPDGSVWWTQQDIAAVGGIVTFANKRYRLGRQVFTPFVPPK